MTELEALARIVWGEAEAEILIGKVAVAAAIINQAAAEAKTILQTVQSPGQFEAYINNRFWQAPYRSSTPAMVQAKQAATRAIGGEDPVYTKTHFCAHLKDPCRWHYLQTPPLQYIGDHLFVRAKIY